MKRNLEELIEMLQERYEQHDYIMEHGSTDRIHSDGTNLNLIRTQISAFKSLILNQDSNYSDEFMRKEIPPEVDYELNVKADEILEEGIRLCETIYSNSKLLEMLDTREALDGEAVHYLYHYLTHEAWNLPKYIEERNIVNIRRILIVDPFSEIDQCYEKYREFMDNNEVTNQMELF
ncbi:hypothetical protein [Breznakia pachnodae]|uniref:Uncharacterized protein n=1 Tax=Breznakia pachnodae TaxID=265178 RepID=A0ABU0E3W0_9FIRM|nr:hypothetical protein [Breznakia pachnodae]MDQ0361588.1 hypothetical protein [Breznakia pachnodae]